MTRRFQLVNFGNCSFLPCDCRAVFREGCQVFVKLSWRKEPVLNAVHDTEEAAQASVIEITNLCRGVIYMEPDDDEDIKRSFQKSDEPGKPRGADGDEFEKRLAALKSH
jgi:hypothetical protein